MITVEADVDLGLPCLTIVGQASGALNQANQRVRAALSQCGQPLLPRKQIVNLGPTELRNDSPGCDLAIACALLASHGVIPTESLADAMLWGELALDGTLRPAIGPLVVAYTAWQRGFRRMIVAEASAREAAMIPGLEIIPVRDLASLVTQLRGEQDLAQWVQVAALAGSAQLSEGTRELVEANAGVEAPPCTRGWTRRGPTPVVVRAARPHSVVPAGSPPKSGGTRAPPRVGVHEANPRSRGQSISY